MAFNSVAIVMMMVVVSEDFQVAEFKASFDISKQVVVLEIPCDRSQLEKASPSKSGKMHKIFEGPFTPVPGLNHIEVEVILARSAKYNTDEPIVDVDWMERENLIK
jgi:hypothetical protein